MSLRTRLIVAFFLLAVVPLAAVTLYTYRSNEEALRVAAEREADLLAGELSQRMQLVTSQLSERVEHLMDIQELQAAVVAAESRTAAQPAVKQPVVVTANTGLGDQIARSLGAAAMLLNNVELQGLRPPGPPRSGRPGTPTRPPGSPTPPSGSPTPPSGSLLSPPGSPTPPPAVGAPAPLGAGPPPPPPPDFTLARRGGPVDGGRGGGKGDGRGDGKGRQARPPGAGPRPEGSTPDAAGRGGQVPPVAPAPPPAAVPSAPVTAASPITATVDNQEAKLMIDLGAVRREVFRQIVPEGRPESMTPEQRTRIAEEINQRMLGIVQGIQLGAKELQKRAAEAEKNAAAQAKAAAAATGAKSASASAKHSASTTVQITPKPATAPKPETTVASGASAMKRKSSISGNRLDVKFERDGQVVRQANAEINLPNVLDAVFRTTQKGGGEVPFAVAKDGRIYARNDAELTRVESFGPVSQPAGPANARLDDWIVVTTQDPSGSGLKLGIARPVGDSLASLRRTAARNAGIGLLFIAVALIGIVPLSSRLTRNLTALSEGVDRIAAGDYGTRVPVKSKDEFGQLAVAFNQMAEDVEKHQRSAIEQERLKRELELGRQIQNEMLPHAPLKLGLTEIKGVSVPAREVGGDFFNYFELSNGQVAVLVGDVSGKGVGAALLMANIQASLRTRLALGQNLSAIAEEIDRDIEDNSPGPLYATLFVGIFDPATRQLQYVNAGHHPQYVLRKAGGLDRMPSTGLPVGLFAGRGHAEGSVQLLPGDVIFFYTDGCVEAEDETGDMFGPERFEALLTSYVADGGGDVLQYVESATSKFRGKREPFDDATMMAVKVG